MKHGAALGFDVDLQATQKSKALLGQSNHVPENIPALEWQEAPQFYVTLEHATISALALRLLMLTAVRSGSLRKARWEHIDADIWFIPAVNMKGRKGKTKGIISDMSMAKYLNERGYKFSPHGFRSSASSTSEIIVS